MEIGTKKKVVATLGGGDGETREIPKFSAKARLLSLLSSIGEEGRSTLLSTGLSVDSEGLTYDGAMAVLERHYKREESLYVRAQKFVTVKQLPSEDARDYLKRVERLSRDLEFFKSDDDDKMEALQTARTNLALVLAVNGLRDNNLCRELIAKSDLDWETLTNELRSRSTAQESVDKLSSSISNVNLASEGSEVSCIETKDKCKCSSTRRNKNSTRYTTDSSGDESSSSRVSYISRGSDRDYSSSKYHSSKYSKYKGSGSGSRGHDRRGGRDSHSGSRDRRYSRNSSRE